jgi:hypothetical protein
VFLVGMFSGCLAMGLVYGAAIWFYPGRWITRLLRDAGFGTALLVRPNRSVQVWTAGVGLVAEKDQEQVAAAEQEMVGVITQWAKTRPLAGYSVAILMTPKGIIHVWTESHGIFVPGGRKWTCEERALLGRLSEVICGPRGVNAPIDTEDKPPCDENPPLFLRWVTFWRFHHKS